MRIWTSSSAEPRPADLRGGAADLELRVAVDDLVALDERREVRLVRDVEEDRADADEEPDDVELAEREDVGDVRDRDRREERGASEVAGDEDRASPEPVDPDAGRQREEQEREELDGSERGDLERAGVEDEDRDERQRELTTCVPNWLIVSADHSLRKSP